MSTLFDKTSLPLWLWIVIIVVGSLCIMGAVGVVILCMVRRRRTAGSVSDIPTRKMTVRRGRVVPASHYLSLTGSKFGLNQFDDDARTNGTRSKSPFEWWNTIKEKRRSHHDDVSHLEASPASKSRLNLNYSVHDTPKSPTDISTEKGPVSRVEEVKAPEPSPTLQKPARVASFSRPFGSDQYQEQPSTEWANKIHARNLSMIKESSPHTSVVSHRTLERRSSRLSGYNPGDSTRRERRPSDHQAGPRRGSNPRNDSRNDYQQPRRSSNHRIDTRNDQQQPRRTSNHRMDPQHDQQQPRRSSSRPSQQRPSNEYNYDSRRPSYGSRRSSDARPDGRRPSGGSSRPSPSSSRRASDRSGTSMRRPAMPIPIPINPSPPMDTSDVPRPIAYRGSRHSLGEEAMASASTLSKRSSVHSRPESITDYTDLARRSSRPKSLVLDDAPSQDAGYYAPRAEMMPVEALPQPPTPTTPTSNPSRAPSIGRSNSRKGNVLRKKSIKRQEVLSYVGA